MTGQRSAGGAVVDAVKELHEVDHVAALGAASAIPQLLGRVDGKAIAFGSV